MENTAPQDISIKLYRSLKRKLQRYEADNYDKIYLIPCNGSENWRELAEHSALIYYYEVCEKLNSKAHFYADTLSLYDEYNIGYMRTLKIDNIRRNLKRVGLYKSEAVNDKFYIFTLNKTFTPNHLAMLKKREEERRAKNLTVIGTNNLNPELHQLIVANATRMHRLCNNHLDKLSSQTIGHDIVCLSDGLLTYYYRLTAIKTTTSPYAIQVLGKMRSNVYSLIFNVRVLGDTKLWDLRTVTSISESLYTIRDKIESQIKRILKNSRETQAKPATTQKPQKQPQKGQQNGTN